MSNVKTSTFRDYLKGEALEVILAQLLFWRYRNLLSKCYSVKVKVTYPSDKENPSRYGSSSVMDYKVLHMESYDDKWWKATTVMGHNLAILKPVNVKVKGKRFIHASWVKDSVNCELMSIDELTTKQLVGVELCLPQIINGNEIRILNRLKRDVENAESRLLNAMPYVGETRDEHQKWFATMAQAATDRKDGDYTDPLNPWGDDKREEDLDAPFTGVKVGDWLEPAGRWDGNFGLLRKVSLNFFIVNKWGKERWVGYNYLADLPCDEWIFKSWIKTHLKNFSHDGKRRFPSPMLKDLRQNKYNHVRYCHGCRRNTRHVLQPQFLVCKGGCGFKSHLTWEMVRFNSGNPTDAMPFEEIPEILTKKWNKNTDVSWYIEVPTMYEGSE